MKTNSYSQVIRLLSLFIILSIICIYSVNTKNIKYCKDLDNDRKLYVEDPKPLSRNLQTITNVHGFRIKFLDAPFIENLDFIPVKNMLDIGAAFFKQLLKVTDVDDSTVYSLPFDCGPTITPTTSPYADVGFSFS